MGALINYVNLNHFFNHKKFYSLIFSAFFLLILNFNDSNKSFIQNRSLISSDPDKLETLRSFENYGKIPLFFEVNHGQTDNRVKYLSRGQDFTLFLTSKEAVLSLKGTETKKGNTEGEKTIFRGPAFFPKLKITG